MSIRIFHHKLGKDGEPEADGKTVHEFPKEMLLFGSDAHNDVCMDGVPSLALSIFKDTNKIYQLERKDITIPIRLNDTELKVEQVPLTSGDEIRLGDHLIVFSVNFTKADQRRSVGIVSYVSALLIALILIVEMAVIVWLPKQVEGRQLWGLEVARQQSLGLMDGLRQRCRESLSDADKDAMVRETVKLILQELDEIAVYLRHNSQYMNVNQILEVKDDLLFFEDLFNRLEAGTLYPPVEVIDANRHVRRLIARYDKEYKDE